MGIGKETLINFLNNDYNVYAADLVNIDIQNDKLHKFKVDITNINDIQKMVNYFEESNIVFDIIINVAGVYKMASFIETDINVINHLLDVNLKGVITVINKTHRFLKEKGKVVIVTSEVAGFRPLPFNGLYSVSKIALENYAQSLRQELNLLNQKVITIRPGSVKTRLQQESLGEIEKFSKETRLFKKEGKKFLNISKKFMGTPMDARKIGHKIYRICNKENPKYVYKIHQNLGLILLNLMPLKIQCFIIKKLLGNGEVR